VLKTVPTMGAGWCPPGMLGVGIGGTAEKAMLLAKESLMEPIDINELKARGASNRAEELRLELFDKVNALGIGAQGLGGLTTVLDIKVKDFPTHAANLPVAMIPNCAATRHAHFTLDGSGPVVLDPPSLEDWPQITYDASKGTRVDLDTITPEDVASWKPGQTLLLNGKLLTGRDAAHKRMVDMLAKGEPLPVDLKGRASTTSARSIRCATKWWARPARPPQRAWTSSPARCWNRPACWAWSARPSAARPRSSDPRQQVGLPDGGGRFGLPGVQGDQGGQGGRLRRPGHGGHLRVHRAGHAGDRGGGFHRRIGARNRAEDLAREDRQDSGHGGLITIAS
jgi:hypothetical protein